MAEECGPGTYQSTDDDGGNSCLPCPQGTWSKNWGLREKGECTRCPTSIICPVNGRTKPCSYTDLPTPYAPVVNYRDMPAVEYAFPTDLRPPPFSIDECLALNAKNLLSTALSSTKVPYFRNTAAMRWRQRDNNATTNQQTAARRRRQRRWRQRDSARSAAAWRRRPEK